jgi:AAA family ATP:ADP antiporter
MGRTVKIDIHNRLAHLIDVERDELAALVWAFTYFFCILCAYFILRPVRDEMAIAGGVRALPWMFTATFVAMLCVVPFFGALVSRFARARLIPVLYGFFVLNLLAFWLFLVLDLAPVWTPRVFFVWISVFNLFVVSVFWSFMVDLFREEQGRRLFGFIAAGGTAGTVAGPLITLSLIGVIGTAHLMLISAGLLVVASACVRNLLRAAARFKSTGRDDHAAQADAPLPGGLFAGLTALFQSPYLAGIALFVALFTWTSTFIYFQQVHIVADAFDSAVDRTRVFAFIDVSVSTLTIVTQLFLTGRFIKRFGVKTAVAFLPMVTAIGFVLFAAIPTVAMLVGFQIIRRASNFAITRPGREMLFTVITREQKYKAKNAIDTLVYRGGDAVSGWAFAGLSRGFGLDLAAIATICVPVALVWAALGWQLGVHQNARASTQPGLGRHPTVTGEVS